MGDIFGVGSMVASGVNAAANIAATKMTNNANKEIQDSVNEANRELAQKQNDFNLQMWHLNNDYNDPAAQVQRLKNAGLSAAAAAQSAANVEAQPVQSADLANQEAPPPMQTPDLSALSGFNIIGVARQIAALEKEQAEADSARQDSYLRTKFLLSDIDVKRATADSLRNQIDLSIKEFPYRLENLKSLTDVNKSSIELNKVYRQQAKANVKLLKQQFSFLEKYNDEELKKISQEVINAKKQYSVLQSQENLNNSEAALNKEKKETQKNITQQEHIKSVLASKGFPDDMCQKLAALIDSRDMSEDDLDKFLCNTKYIVKSGAQVLRGDEYSESYYDYIFNQGTAKENTVNVWSPKGFTNMFRRAINRF